MAPRTASGTVLEGELCSFCRTYQNNHHVHTTTCTLLVHHNSGAKHLSFPTPVPQQWAQPRCHPRGRRRESSSNAKTCRNLPNPSLPAPNLSSGRGQGQAPQEHQYPASSN